MQNQIKYLKFCLFVLFNFFQFCVFTFDLGEGIEQTRKRLAIFLDEKSIEELLWEEEIKQRINRIISDNGKQGTDQTDAEDQQRESEENGTYRKNVGGSLSPNENQNREWWMIIDLFDSFFGCFKCLIVLFAQCQLILYHKNSIFSLFQSFYL